MTLNELIDKLTTMRDKENAGDYKVMIPIIYRYGYVFRGNGMVDMIDEDVSINHLEKACDITIREDVK